MPSNAKMPHPTIHNFQNLSGRKFGRLSIQHYVGNASWLTKCDCGNDKVVPTKQLLRSQTQSCGCLMLERTKEANTRHGKKGTRVYSSWTSMLDRCRNERSKDFERYGKRGITVCDEWLNFENFYRDMGDPPPKHSIDRINNSLGYCLSNCQWSTAQQQASNRRSSVFVELDGKRMTAAQCDRILGRHNGTTARRVRQGKPVK